MDFFSISETMSAVVIILNLHTPIADYNNCLAIKLFLVSAIPRLNSKPTIRKSPILTTQLHCIRPPHMGQTRHHRPLQSHHVVDPDGHCPLHPHLLHVDDACDCFRIFLHHHTHTSCYSGESLHRRPTLLQLYLPVVHVLVVCVAH